MNYDELKKRYENNSDFNALVNVLYSAMFQFHFTGTELKEAAYFAAIKFEFEHARPFMVKP